jgi:uncharacterized membrane protein
LRVLTRPHALSDIACPALAAVARYGLADADVTGRLLRLATSLAAVAGPGTGAALAELAADIRQRSETRANLDFDRRAIWAAAEKEG